MIPALLIRVWPDLREVTSEFPGSVLVGADLDLERLVPRVTPKRVAVWRVGCGWGDQQKRPQSVSELFAEGLVGALDLGRLNPNEPKLLVGED